MRKILALCFLFSASICWGQYIEIWSPGTTDVTPYLPTKNAWKPLPQQGTCNADSLRIGADGFIMCIGGNIPYSTQAYGTGYTGGWVNHGEMGTSTNQLTLCDQSHVYDLANDGTIQKWMGDHWQRQGGTAVKLAAAPDDCTLVAINAAGYTYSSTNEGVSWTTISGGSFGPNLSYVTAANQALMCGTNGTQIFVWQKAGGFRALQTQPANSDTGIDGCVIGDDTMFVWSHHVPTGHPPSAVVGVQRYDYKTATWNVVTGLYPSGMTTAQKGMSLSLDSSGHPYHLNVYAGWISGQITGSFNGCPGPSDPCAPGVTHTGKLQVKFPISAGIQQGGTLFTQAVSPTTYMSLSAYDISVACDPFYGDPADQNCIPTDPVNGVNCSASGTDFLGGGSPPPPVGRPNKSLDVRAWDHSTQMSNERQTGDGYYGEATFGSTTNACAPATVPTCPGRDSVGPKAFQCFDTIRNGVDLHDCAPSDVEFKALNYAHNRSLDATPPGAWSMIDTYKVVNGSPQCEGSTSLSLISIIPSPAYLFCH